MTTSDMAAYRTAAEVEAATPRACAHCPWRLSNQGRRHPNGWYTKANLARLWSKLRRGERMTCHPTDPTNPVPPGGRVVPVETTTHECTGSLVLVQRELDTLGRICDELPEGSRDGLRVYRQRHPKGLTRDGVGELVARLVLGGVPVVGYGKTLVRPDLTDPDVGYPPLGTWSPPRS